MKGALGRAGLVLASLLVSLLIVEMIYRAFLPQPLFRIRFSPTLVWEQEPGASYLYVKDEFQSPVTYNAAGLRDTEHSLKKPRATFRIAMLGDSFTEALQVKLEETYPKQLENILNWTVSEVRYEVINFGATGYGPDQYLLRLRDQALAYEPDLVLVGIFINDLDDLAELGLSRLEHGSLLFKTLTPGSPEAILKRVKFFARGHSHLFTFLTFLAVRIRHLSPSRLRVDGGRADEQDARLEGPELLRRYHKTYPDTMKAQVELAEALFKEMRHLTTRRGSNIAAVILPAQEQVYESRYLALRTRYGLAAQEFDSNLPQRLVGRIAESAAIPLVDPLPQLKKIAGRGLELYFLKDGHLNARGNRLIAEILANELAAGGFLGRRE